MKSNVNMKKIYIPAIIATIVFTFNGINSAEDTSLPQYPVVDLNPIVVPIPRPTPHIDACTRNQTFAKPIEEVIDGPIPLHCLQPNCGLGVYRKKENDTVERCSYCEAPKPEQG